MSSEKSTRGDPRKKSTNKGHGKWDSDESDSEDEHRQEKYEKPELLIRFSGLRKKRLRMDVQTGTLERVLKLANDLPLCVLNIAGPENLGKSFLLNNILQKLETWERTGKKDAECDRAPLRFPCKNNGNGQGVIIWPQPFIVTNDNKEKFAVLVTETNGLHDEIYDSKEALTSIYCLCFLISSALIYNTSEQCLTEDAIMPWMPIVNFGQQLIEGYASSKTDHAKPFQTLSFLIRDWDHETEDFHGSKDRLDFLLREVKRISMSNERKRNSILTAITEYFSAAECSLLPPPGEAAHSSKYDGSLSQLEPDFVSKLNKYVNKLLSPKRLKVKTVCNSTMTPFIFERLLSEYVHLINSYNTDTKKLNGQTIKEITDKTLIGCIVGRAGELYESIMEKEFDVDDSNIQSMHIEAQKKANNFLKNALLGVRSTDLSDCKKQLSNIILHLFKKFNQKRDEQTSEKLEEILKLYTKHLKKTLVFEDEFKFFDESYIEAASGDTIKRLQPDVVAMFATEGEAALSNIRHMLATRANLVVKSIQEVNEENRQNAKKYILNCIDKMKCRHISDLQSHIELQGIAPQILMSSHNLLVKRALDDFRHQRLPGPEEFRESFQSTLLDCLEKAFTELQEGDERIQRVMEEQASKLTASLKHEYEKEFLSSIDTCTSKEEFDNLHHNISETLTAKLQQQYPHSIESPNWSKDLQKFQYDLDLIYSELVDRHLEQQQLNSENYQTGRNRALSEYIHQMENEIKSGSLSAEDLENAHSKHSFNCLQLMEFDAGDEIAANHYRNDLENRILEAFKTFKTKNNRLYQNDAEAQKMLSDIQNKYVGRMVTFKNKEEIDEANSKYLKEYSTALTEKFGEQNPEMKSKFLDKFKRFYKQAKDAITGSLTDKEKVQFSNLIMYVRGAYHEDMVKFIKGKNFSDCSGIEDIHKRVIDSAIRNSDFEVSPEQRMKIIDLMEDSITKYKIEYAMSRSDQTENPAIGIDLGTTYCCVAVILNEQKLQIIRSSEGFNTTASYVAFNRDETYVVGQTAKDDAYLNPEYTIFDAKRILGRRFQDVNLQNDMQFWPFSVSDNNGTPMIDINNASIHPEHVSAVLLAQLKSDAEEQLRTKISRAVITVPAYFNDRQRAATKDAAEIAGFEVLTILNEPTAAAIAYKIEHFSDAPKNVLVYDLGGGTFDVAVLRTEAKSIRVLAVDGDTHLGGEDFDKSLMNECVKLFKKKTGINLFQNKDSSIKQERENARRIIRRLQTYSEKAKVKLSSATQATVSVDSIVPGHDFYEKITRARFEELNHDLFSKTIKIVKKVLNEANVKKEHINDILLVGGSTRIPKIKKMLEELFNNKILSHSVHPDIAVAYGAAVQAALLNGINDETLLHLETINDVTPMSLGISTNCATKSESYSVIIKRNTKIPHATTKQYVLSVKNESSINFHVHQGDNPTASNNDVLGSFELTDIHSYKSGKEKIAIEMEINHMGLLNVTALCKRTGEKKSIVLKMNQGRLSNQEKAKIAESIKDAISSQTRNPGTDDEMEPYTPIVSSEIETEFAASDLSSDEDYEEM